MAMSSPVARQIGHVIQVSGHSFNLLYSDRFRLEHLVDQAQATNKWNLHLGGYPTEALVIAHCSCLSSGLIEAKNIRQHQTINRRWNRISSISNLL